MIRLSDYVRADLAVDCDEAHTKHDVLAAAGELLAETGIVSDRQALVAEFEQREALGSTGVGHGIALAHASHAAVDRITVLVCRLAQPVDWQSVDGEPVRLALVIVSPVDQRPVYLQLLAELARALTIEDLRGRALKAGTASKAAAIIATPPRQSFFRRNRRLLFYLAAIAVIFGLSRLAMPAINLPAGGLYERLGHLRFNAEPWLFRQELTVTLFLGMVLGTLLFWRFRVAIAAAGLGILLVAGIMDLETTVKFMSIPTILFIMSMMVIVRWLQNIGVFRFIVVKAIEQVKGVPWLLLLILMGFSVILGGFADEVSAILVTFGLALEVSRRARAPLTPFLLSLVFATNVGSALTLVGNPIGVYIAFAGRLSFEDFLRWASPISAIAAVVVAGLCLLLYRKHFFGKRYDLDARELEQTAGIVDRAKMRTGIITFCVMVVLIALHRRIELLMGLSDGTALVAAALLVTGFIVFHEQERGRVLVERGIDWWTLLFFMFLFANAACLEYTGVTTKLGHILVSLARTITGGSTGTNVTAVTAVLMLWLSGLTSGFVDNLPIVAALAPIVRDMGPAGVDLPHASIVWWALLFGGCFGGNLTVIGSTANLVAVGAFERVTGRHIRFAEWIKVGVIITVVSLVIATVALLLQIDLAP